MLIYLFSAWACSAVGRTAQEVVKEVRRQFIERPGIMVSKVFVAIPLLLILSIFYNQKVFTIINSALLWVHRLHHNTIIQTP